MLNIFVSSTFQDLKEEREAVRSIIAGLAHTYPVGCLGMEDFGSHGASPFETSAGFTEKADMVVLIVGNSYGSIAPDLNISFTEAEFEVILRDKIPCLAYLRNASESSLDQRILEFRSRINQEVTSTAYSDKDDLKVKVRRDLESELRNLTELSDSSELALESKPFVNYRSFHGQQIELKQLSDGLASENNRICVCGVRGIGKTTFVQYFFNSKGPVYDPIWLRIDDLFGRHVNGRLRLGQRRWRKEPLLLNLKKLLEQRPRAVLIFDNVQAAPLLVGWLANRLGSTPIVFLSWDIRSLPFSELVIKLEPLNQSDASELIFHYCNKEQKYEEGKIWDLCLLLENHPLMLSLAGNRLRFNKRLTISELIDELNDVRNQLRLQTKSVDEYGETVKALLLSTYQCLNANERRILSALAALPSRGISEESLQWLVKKIDGQSSADINRAEELGLVERRWVVDYRGHKYRLRSIIAEFLCTTDAFVESSRFVQSYLDSDMVYSDSSMDMVYAGLKKQLEQSAPDIPPGFPALRLLVNGRPTVRSEARNILSVCNNSQQLNLLINEVESLLDSMRSEDITLELLSLLEHWQIPQRLNCLERLWLRPMVWQYGEKRQDNIVRLAAGKAIASGQRLPISDFIKSRLQHRKQNQILAALDALYVKEMPAVDGDLIKLLKHTDTRIRAQSASTISSFVSSKPMFAELLFEIFNSDPNQEVRYCAADTLGIWADPRVLPFFLNQLRDIDHDQRSNACSILWRYRNMEVADEILRLAYDDDDWDVKQTATFVLVDFVDPRASILCLDILKRGCDDEQKEVFTSFVSMLESRIIPEDVKLELSNLLVDYLKLDNLKLSLLSHCALINLEDPRGYDDLWDNLEEALNESNSDLNSYVSYVLQTLASPPILDFEPTRLRRFLHAQGTQVRSAAVLLAGQTRSKILVDELQLLVEDETLEPLTNTTIAVLAQEALDRVFDKRELWTPFSKRNQFGAN